MPCAKQIQQPVFDTALHVMTYPCSQPGYKTDKIKACSRRAIHLYISSSSAKWGRLVHTVRQGVATVHLPGVESLAICVDQLLHLNGLSRQGSSQCLPT